VEESAGEELEELEEVGEAKVEGNEEGDLDIQSANFRSSPTNIGWQGFNDMQTSY